jgi:hypothetical protein
MTKLKDGGAQMEVGPHSTIGVAMEDLPKAERIALEKELEEETFTARRRKLACFKKTCTRVIMKTTPTIMTIAITAAASTVTPNMTPEELVKFMDIAIASKYGNDLSNLMRVITNDVHSTLESFETDLQNALPRQIRSVVQQVQGETQGKQPDLAHSTAYPGNTSTLGNMGTLFLGSSTAPGNTGVLANTSTPHPGSTSGYIIYVDASSLHLESTSLGNPGFFSYC